MKLSRSGFVTSPHNTPLYAFKPESIKDEYAYLTITQIKELYDQVKHEQQR